MRREKADTDKARWEQKCRNAAMKKQRAMTLAAVEQVRGVTCDM